MQFYATAFAQGGLYHFMEGDRSEAKGGRSDNMGDGKKAFTVEDLKLVWRIAMYGWAFGGAVFFPWKWFIFD